MPLAMLVKEWSKARGIASSPDGFLSSFSYTLLVLFFLQRRGVLPNLQSPGLCDACERATGRELPEVTVGGYRIRYCPNIEFLGAVMTVRLKQHT